MVDYSTAQAVVYDIEMWKTATKLDSATSYNHTPPPTHKHTRSTSTQHYHTSVTRDDMCSLKDCVTHEGEAEEEL